MRRDFLKYCIVGLPTATWLAGCGGGGSSSAGVRLANATRSVGALDVLIGSNGTIGSTAPGAVSSYSSVDASSATAQIRNASGTTVATRGLTPSKDVNYTLVAYNYLGNVSTVVIADSQTAPASGYASVRIFNASTVAGMVDVYLTDPAAALLSSSPTFAGVGTASTSGFMATVPGTYRLRVTGAGDKNDIRLDTTVTVADQQISTLMLTPTTGGVLLNLDRLDQSGALTQYTNNAVRVRVVAGASGNAFVTARTSDGSLQQSLMSPSSTDYVQVPAGLPGLAITVGGAPVAVPAFSAVAGQDITLLVLGSPGSAQVVPMIDDNAPPTAAGTATLRVVHGINGLPAPITLTANYISAGTNVPLGSASTPTPVSAGSGATLRLDVTTPSNALPLWTATDVQLTAGKVYTLFMLGDAAAPRGVLRRDR